METLSFSSIALSSFTLLGLTVVGLALLCLGIGYGFTQLSASRNQAELLVERINDCLPQTQCAQCDYPGCRPYAEAIAAGDAKINQCPPGGDATIQALSELLGVPVIPLNTDHGAHKAPQVAFIDEAVCIGCTLCIPPCPVDAIVGSTKLMHTVIAEDCTGCELCIEPCPVDCIALIPAKPEISQWRHPRPSQGTGPQSEAAT